MSIRADVDRGLEIVETMDKLKEELKEIEGRLVKAGMLGKQVDLEDAEREGKQYLANGSKAIVPVVFTADMIIKSFLAQSAQHLKILGACVPGNLEHFYHPKITFESLHDSGKAFRRVAAEVLGAEAPAFVSACVARGKNGIPKSQIKVEWNRADATASGANDETRMTNAEKEAAR